MKEGAVLCLPIQAKGENTVARTKFGKWIIKNIDRWFAWARQLELGVERMEDIILVTGTHRTRSWTNAAFPAAREVHRRYSAQEQITKVVLLPFTGNSHTSTIEGWC